MLRHILFPVLAILVVFSSRAQVIGHFTDARDGKQYKTIKIGSQVWMGENLNWESKEDSWKYGNSDSLADIYGRLYTWEIAKRACPLGWHFPSDDEWETMINSLGGDSIAGGKLKEAGLVHWKKPNALADNKSGFNALPAGNRSSFNGEFYGVGKYTCWWSSTEHKDTGEISVFSLNYMNGAISNGWHNREFGYSVRCVKN
mgnify:CR=1 FL=1